MSFFPTADNLSWVALQPNEGEAFEVLGDTLTVKVSGKDTGGALKELAMKYGIEILVHEDS